MKAATLFSGIGAPEQAMPSWHWPWHAEIDKFPAAIMAARHPRSANLGDVTAHDFADRAAAVARPDVLVFGSPCQSYSVAGKRLGLDDPRGNLALVALGIVARLEPRWFVFENVPGLLSSSEGRDFGLFLRAVDEIGYSLCWAVLDAQFFGVAQRRERVFAVGYLGDWRGPAAVLLEPESLCGDPPTREQARQDVAGAIGAGSKRSGGRLGRREAAAGHVVAGTLGTRSADHPSGVKSEADFLVAFNNTGQGWWNETDAAQCVRKGDEAGGGGARESTLVAHSLRADGFDASEDGTGRGTPLVAQTLEAGGHSHNPLHETLIAASGVRRLMPSECEALQGFPCGYTAITYRGKPAADGPRYKALGNSMAVPVLAWILSRVDRVDAMMSVAA